MSSFRAQYARARADQAEFYASQIIDIADESTDNIYYVDLDGNRRIDPGAVQLRRLQIDSRKWYAGKLAPKVYGDKVDVNVGGQEDNPLTVLYKEISGSGFTPKE